MKLILVTVVMLVCIQRCTSAPLDKKSLERLKKLAQMAQTRKKDGPPIEQLFKVNLSVLNKVGLELLRKCVSNGKTVSKRIMSKQKRHLEVSKGSIVKFSANLLTTDCPKCFFFKSTTHRTV